MFWNQWIITDPDSNFTVGITTDCHMRHSNCIITHQSNLQFDLGSVTNQGLAPTSHESLLPTLYDHQTTTLYCIRIKFHHTEWNSITPHSELRIYKDSFIKSQKVQMKFHQLKHLPEIPTHWMIDPKKFPDEITRDHTCSQVPYSFHFQKTHAKNSKILSLKY